jgi:hypothetical protein
MGGAETLADATLWRAGDTVGGATVNYTYQFWLAGPTQTSAFDECVAVANCKAKGEIQEPLSAANRVVVPVSHLGTHIYVNASCSGQVGQSTVVNENGGHCRNVGQTTDGLLAFLYVQPCLASVSADVGFDTTKVSDGAHHLVVSVIDAAGNAAPVLDRTVTITNRRAAAAQGSASGANGNGANGQAGQPNGVVASNQAILAVQWNSTRSERLTSSYGRTKTVVGRLTAPSGAPIAGAQIDLVAAPSYTGAKPVTMTSPRTASDGTFSVRLPGGTRSETLHFAYRSRIGDVLPVATRTLTLSVRAGIALSISPHLASVGRTIFFRGRLLGGAIPRGGKQLVLEARSSSSSWLEFNVIRANARGLYRASYRFKFPGPIRYQFRVVSEPEADYPFAGGSSNVVGVRER